MFEISDNNSLINLCAFNDFDSCHCLFYSPRTRGRSSKRRIEASDSTDQISSVSGTVMGDGHDQHEDDVVSPEMGQGSLNEIEPALLNEEKNLQIVPSQIRDEVSAAAEPTDESNAFMHRGADILASTRMFSCFECPPIPLCRLFPYARVRGLRNDLSGLKSAFAKEGYMQEKGSFIVSLWTCQKEEKMVTGQNFFILLNNHCMCFFCELNIVYLCR